MVRAARLTLCVPRAPALRVAISALLVGCAPSEPVVNTSQAIRPDQPGIGPPAFDATERVQTYASPSGAFLMHYTLAGRNAVPLLDADQSGTADFVEEAAEIYDRVLVFYRDMRGLRAPPSDVAVSGGNGGDGRFDVYLLDFAGRSDGAFRRENCDPARALTCPGYMLQENDYVGYPYPSTRVGTTVLASHEFFHAIQAGYDVRRGAILEEATAVWGTEQFDPSLRDFEALVPGYFSRPDRSLDQVQTGPVDSFSYGAAIFFQFLTERHDNRLVARLWTACGTNDGSTAWLDLLDEVLRRDYGSTFALEYSEFAVWNLYTAARANPVRAYANGAAYPLVAVTRSPLPFMDTQVRLFHAATRYYAVAPGDRSALTVALVPPPGGSQSALDGLELRVALRRGNTVETPRRLMNLSSGEELVDVSTATEVIVLLSNLRTQGPSRTPGVCIGSPDELRLCLATLSASQSSDAGATLDGGASPDVGATPDGGLTVDLGLRVDAAMPGGCACASLHPSLRLESSLSALLVGVVGVLGRRRRRAQSSMRAFLRFSR